MFEFWLLLIVGSLISCIVHVLLHKMEKGPITPRTGSVFVGTAMAICFFWEGWKQGDWQLAAELGIVGLAIGTYAGSGLGLVAMALKGALRRWLGGQRAEQVAAGELVLPAFKLNDMEQLVLTGNANHIRRYEAVGGRLLLTTQRLIFIPHLANIQIERLDIPRNQIASVEKILNLGFIPNGLAVFLRDGTKHRFVTWRPTRWVAALHDGAILA